MLLLRQVCAACEANELRVRLYTMPVNNADQTFLDYIHPYKDNLLKRSQDARSCLN
eukprot:m.151962 g.151962  ORF g.151962 m.151962 type:complete len:56 (-) comp16351_c0_seq3:109-276(-)